MVRNFSVILALFFALFTSQPGLAAAADFTSTVDSNHVVVGEGLSLRLTLSGTSAKNDPDTGALQQEFTVVSQGQTSNTTIINGRVSSNVGWELTLIPKKKGNVVIPPVTIDTDVGTLSTQPITLEVESAAAQPAHTSHSDISITAAASEKDPYQNQPISYTVRIVARANIADVSLGDVAVDHAIVQQQGKPEISDQVESGVPVKMIKFHYLITPLTAQKITIPPVVLQGNIEMAETPRRPDSLDNDMMDPFRMLQNMRSLGFSNYKPFSIASNTVELDVKPPAVAMDPWLPLRSLQISESMDLSQQIKVGEPLTRKLVLLADGAVGSQLPSLEPQQNHADFKVYADKPSVGEDIDKKTGAISGWRRESYTLIPQKAGRLVLPEIKVPWWDIANNKIAYAVLPEQIVNVLPAAAVQSSPSVASGEVQKPSQAAPAQLPTQAITQEGPSLLYAVVTALVFGLMLVGFWALSLQRKINRLGISPVKENKPATKAHNEQKPLNETDLDQVKTVQELNRFLQIYAAEHWGIAKNTSLEDIFLSRQKSRNGVAVDEMNAVVKDITAALYAGKAVDMVSLKARCSKVISSIGECDGDQGVNRERLQKLNPS